MTAQKTGYARFDEAEIDAIFADVDQCGLPGAAVAIAIDGLPVYRKGFGLANMELPTLLTPSMRMRIGSTTKHFAALAYMLLCEEGLAGLDDEIGEYVPGLAPVSARATIRRLIGHTSGIRDVLSASMALHGVGRPISDEAMLAYYATIEDVDFEPGTRWSYNNGGYVLLTAAIEKIAGKPLDEVLRERIFTPVGMHDTMLRRWESDFVANSATLHFRDAGGAFSKTHMGVETSGVGGIVSTMDDMLLWLRHMDAPVVGTAATWQSMREPQQLGHGRSTRYGLGLFCDTYRGIDVVHHAGDVIAGNSQMIKVPAAKLDISIAVNRSDVSSVMLALKIIDAMVEGLEPLPRRVDYERRTGAFVSPHDGRVVTLATADDMHWLTIDGGAPVPISADAAGVLHLPAPAAFLQRELRYDGDGIVLSDFGNEDRLAEVRPDADARLGLRSGTYRCDAFDATLAVAGDAQGAHALLRGRHGWVDCGLTPITADIWRLVHKAAAPIGGIVTFHADGSGLDFDSNGIRRLRFTKVD